MGAEAARWLKDRGISAYSGRSMNASRDSLDLTKPFRGVEDLEKLVTFVYGTNPKNETNWLEWKRGLDLTTKGGRLEAAERYPGVRQPLARYRSALRRRLGVPNPGR